MYMCDRSALLPTGIDTSSASSFGWSGIYGVSFFDGQAPVVATVKITLLSRFSIVTRTSF